MNDFNNYNIIKPKNVEELFKIILEIITRLYEKHIPDEVKHRKNKELAKMSDAEIIAIQILMECLGKTQNSGY